MFFIEISCQIVVRLVNCLLFSLSIGRNNVREGEFFLKSIAQLLSLFDGSFWQKISFKNSSLVFSFDPKFWINILGYLIVIIVTNLYWLNKRRFHATTISLEKKGNHRMPRALSWKLFCFLVGTWKRAFGQTVEYWIFYFLCQFPLALKVK